MKIAVLGDSHVAALKSAWEGMAHRHPGTSLTFFASRSDGLSGLQAEGSALVAGNDTLRGHLRFTSGGLERIVPGDFDLVVIYGLRFLMSGDDDGIYSAAVRAAARHDRLAECLSLVTLRKLRSISDLPCIVGPSPPTVSPDAAAQPLSADDLASVERLLQSSTLDTLRATLVCPPLEVMVQPMNTDRRFLQQALTLAVGDVRDGSKARANNQRHMNADYGRLWLVALFDRLQSGPGIAA